MDIKDMIIGSCDICGKENVNLSKKIYHYPIKCQCHTPLHFEVVYHCEDCQPVEPELTNISIRTDELHKIINDTTGGCAHIYVLQDNTTGKHDILECTKCGHTVQI